MKPIDCLYCATDFKIFLSVSLTNLLELLLIELSLSIYLIFY